MQMGPLPDLASTLRLQRDAASVRDSLASAGRELSTLRREDLYAASGGDPRRLLAIESAQARAAREGEGVALAQGRASVTQTVMAGLEAQADALGVELAASLGRGDMVSARIHAAGAADAFRGAVKSLNGTYGGRSLFAGAAVDSPALSDAELILGDVRTIVAGAADADDAIAQVRAYFDDPAGGFATNRFLGAAENAPRATTDQGGVLDVSRRADDPEVRTLLRGLALAAIAAEDDFVGPTESASALLDEAARTTMAAREDLVHSRARLGISEQGLEEAAVRIAARSDALDIAWNTATTRDPFEAAAEFQALEQQLERVFTVTARLSQLSLTDFLR